MVVVGRRLDDAFALVALAAAVFGRVAAVRLRDADGFELAVLVLPGFAVPVVVVPGVGGFALVAGGPAGWAVLPVGGSHVT